MENGEIFCLSVCLSLFFPLALGGPPTWLVFSLRTSQPGPQSVGLPAWSAGVPARSEGLPAKSEGLPARSEGLPAVLRASQPSLRAS